MRRRARPSRALFRPGTPTGRSALHGLLVLGLVGCGDEPREPTPWTWRLPSGFPEPKVPDDNPMTVEKVELGRLLFFDPLLSVNRTQSCASCHDPALAFTDGRRTSLGSTGEATRRNSMSLVNVAYASTLHWADPDLETLEEQARRPLLQTDPIELGMGGREDELARRLSAEPRYAEGFARAFPEDAELFEPDRIVARVAQALAAFQRSLISGNAPYDRFVNGDPDALSPSALRGLELFFGERLECFHCHGGFNFSQSTVHAGSALEETPFHNTGLYNVDGRGGYPASDKGLAEVTGEPGDDGRFRAPTLRFVTLTAPYMHDGSVATLDEAIDHYARGGRRIESGPNAGDGRRSLLKSSFVSGFRLTPQERVDLKVFLESLVDEEFLQNPRLQSPY